MPKIFGKVGLIGDNLACNNCGYTWKPTQENLEDLRLRHKITCPFCRITKDHPIDKPLNKEGTIFINAGYIKYLKYNSLMGSDKNAIVMYVSTIGCGHNSFTVKLGEVEDFLENPRCLPCSKLGKYKNIDKTADKPKDINKECVENPDEAKVNPDNTVIMEPDKPKRLSANKKFDMLKDKIFNGSTKVLDFDSSRGMFTVTCIHCGAIKSVNAASIKANNTSVMVCDVCNNNPFILDEMIDKHVGRIYNGLMITKVYTNEDNITLCDVSCIHSGVIEDNRVYYSHTFTGLQLYDVINNREYCRECNKSFGKSEQIVSDIVTKSGCTNLGIKLM